MGRVAQNSQYLELPKFKLKDKSRVLRMLAEVRALDIENGATV